MCQNHIIYGFYFQREQKSYMKQRTLYIYLKPMSINNYHNVAIKFCLKPYFVVKSHATYYGMHQILVEMMHFAFTFVSKNKVNHLLKIFVAQKSDGFIEMYRIFNKIDGKHPINNTRLETSNFNSSMKWKLPINITDYCDH